jgi:RNA polymerase sigma-70 factor (ECF subfamily)
MGVGGSKRPGEAVGEPSEVPDELVVRAVAGDADAAATILGIVRPIVVRYCRARLGRSPVAVDDVAQEVCLAIWRALPGYRLQGRPFLAFVYSIASRKVVDAHRSVARDKSRPVAEVPDLPVDADDPEEGALRAEVAADVHRLLDLLPPPQREILALRVVVGLSAKETAEAVGSTPGAVRLVQHRALAKLRQAVAAGELAPAAPLAG